ncbi:MAG: hypothetical protein GWN58_05195 [Anaerolineae bacterium]|nr:hypothetical protein [Anaerolineae bacterium]
MTPRQRTIIAILAVIDIGAILALMALVTHPDGTDRSPLPTPLTLTPAQERCQWRAAQLLARAGLGGTVTLTADGPLRFDIAYPLAPGQTTDEAAQSVWTAFDIALALQEPEDECAIFAQVEVTVLAQGNRADTQISASVSVADLIAYDAGELSEDQFIERVRYGSTTEQP